MKILIRTVNNFTNILRYYFIRVYIIICLMVEYRLAKIYCHLLKLNFSPRELKLILRIFSSFSIAIKSDLDSILQKRFKSSTFMNNLQY